MHILRHLLVAPITLPVVIMAFVYYFSAWAISWAGKPGKQLSFHLFVLGDHIWIFNFCDRLFYWADGKPKHVKTLIL